MPKSWLMGGRKPSCVAAARRNRTSYGARTSLPPDGHAVLAWIASRRIAAGLADDRLCAAERDGVLRHDVVSHRAQRGAHVVADRRLERHAEPGEVAETRRVDHLLDVH